MEITMLPKGSKMSNPHPVGALGLGAIKKAMLEAKRMACKAGRLVKLQQVQVEILEEEWDKHSFLSKIFLHSDEWRKLSDLQSSLLLNMETEDRFNNEYRNLCTLFEKEKKRIEENCKKQQ